MRGLTKKSNVDRRLLQSEDDKHSEFFFDCATTRCGGRGGYGCGMTNIVNYTCYKSI